MGALDAEFGSLSGLRDCITDAEHIYTDITTAVKDFEKKTIAGDIDGIKELAKLLGDTKLIIKDCKSFKMGPEFAAKFAEIIKIYSNWWLFTIHTARDIEIYGHQIYSDIENGIKAYHQGQFFMFGKYIGDASAKALLGSQTQGYYQKT